ncbi:FkbM family methyltransferase [Citromicrobium bathyomarinum]|uniref:FkbM family methyltransferase n=1 Tax=Citromicrobium bathyomarinum TaxID=72174 RepID=UPI003159B4F8
MDVGANWGQSILAPKRCARPRRILSFEPNPKLVARLQLRYRDDPSVQIDAMALGLREGPYELLIPSYLGLTNTIFLTDEQRSAMPF